MTAVRPKGFIGAERVAEKCDPVAAAAAVAPGYSEAAADLCVNKHCLLNICEVVHEGNAVNQASHSYAGSSINFQAAAKEVYSGREDSQLWISSEAALQKNVQLSVAESSLAETATGLGGVDTTRSALRHYFSVNCPDIMCPTDGTEVSQAMKGIKRRFAKPVSKKSPLTSEQFYKILDKLLDKGGLSRIKLCQLRLAAQISVMFLSFSRFEESSALLRSQVKKIQGDLLVTFKKGKNFQFGEARKSVIAGQPGPKNPVTVILSYMDRLATVDKSVDGFLFPALRSTSAGDSVLARPASYNSVLRQFKEVVTAAGVSADPSTFGLHSMRRGAVTAAINNGATDHAVQKQMRVASGATVRRYASLSDVMLKSASAAIFKKV